MFYLSGTPGREAIFRIDPLASCSDFLFGVFKPHTLEDHRLVGDLKSRPRTSAPSPGRHVPELRSLVSDLELLPGSGNDRWKAHNSAMFRLRVPFSLLLRETLHLYWCPRHSACPPHASSDPLPSACCRGCACPSLFLLRFPPLPGDFHRYLFLRQIDFSNLLF